MVLPWHWVQVSLSQVGNMWEEEMIWELLLVAGKWNPGTEGRRMGRLLPAWRPPSALPQAHSYYLEMLSCQKVSELFLSIISHNLCSEGGYFTYSTGHHTCLGISNNRKDGTDFSGDLVHDILQHALVQYRNSCQSCIGGNNLCMCSSKDILSLYPELLELLLSAVFYKTENQ